MPQFILVTEDIIQETEWASEWSEYRASTPLEGISKSAADRVERCIEFTGKTLHRRHCTECDECYDERILNQILSTVACDEGLNLEAYIEDQLTHNNLPLLDLLRLISYRFTDLRGDSA